MNPFEKTIIFEKTKKNHFYAIKSGTKYLKVDNPKIGDVVYEVPVVSGGSKNTTISIKKSILLQIPIPLCKNHQHNGLPFGVKTCNNWNYIIIPTPLGSLSCRECSNELYLPEPFLRNANLNNANLNNANFNNANLSNANLNNAYLRGADLRGVNLNNADLNNANLSNANLSNANFNNANLNNANLNNANLSNADLSNADLNNANLNNANLNNANLSNADLSNANLNNAYLRGAKYNSFTLKKINELWKKQLIQLGINID